MARLAPGNVVRISSERELQAVKCLRVKLLFLNVLKENGESDEMRRAREEQEHKAETEGGEAYAADGSRVLKEKAERGAIERQGCEEEEARRLAEEAQKKAERVEGGRGTSCKGDSRARSSGGGRGLSCGGDGGLCDY